MNSNDQAPDPPEQRHDFQPGQTISPSQAGATQPDPAPLSEASPVAPPPASQRAEISPQATSTPATPLAPVAPAASAASEADASFYHPDSQLEPADQPITPTPFEPQMQENGREIVWTAAEFIEHQKSPGWYLAMIGIALLAVGLAFLITHDLFATIVVAVAAIIFGVAAARPPRQMQYAVDDHGVQIGRRLYPYSNFRSFSVVDEDQAVSIVMMPLKRFMPPLSLYFDPADEELIGDILVSHLPYAEHQFELTERLMRRIRF